MDTEAMKGLTEGLKLFASASAVTVLIYKGLMWCGRGCAKTERRWWTRRRLSEMETLAFLTTAYFPLAISYGVVGEKVTACLLALGFSLMGSLFTFTVFVWPSASETFRRLRR